MSAKKSTIFIHIGTIKTGTTSLQNFFHLNRESLLRNHGIFYPKTPGHKNHTKLPLYAFDQNMAEMRTRHGIQDARQLENFRKTFKQAFGAEIKPQLELGNDILVSSEHLSSRAMDNKDLIRLLELFEDYKVNIKIIVYLRRQDRMMLSTYSTWVKSGGRWNLNPDAYKNRRYDHLAMLDLWSGAVGIENVVVRVFEKSKLIDGDLYADFCCVLGINPQNQLKIPPKDKLNSSLDEEQIQFLKLFNKFVPTLENNKTNSLRGNIVEYLEAYTNNNRLDISYSQKQAIYKYFEKNNNLIAIKYLNLKEPLFDSISEADSKNEPVKLTTEKAIEISAHLWLRQQKVINNHSLSQAIKKSLKKLFRL